MRGERGKIYPTSEGESVEYRVTTTFPHRASSHTFNVAPNVTMTIHMLSGEVTGAQLAGKIKALKPTVTVILHSGTPPSTMRHLDGFIHKGEPTSTLIAFIRNLVNRFSE